MIDALFPIRNQITGIFQSSEGGIQGRFRENKPVVTDHIDFFIDLIPIGIVFFEYGEDDGIGMPAQEFAHQVHDHHSIWYWFVCGDCRPNAEYPG